MTKRILLTLLFILLALGGGGAYYWRYHRGPDAALELAGVVESQEVRLGSKLGGRVAAVEVQEGDTVQAGQLLVRLAQPELEAQRRQAGARVQAAAATLEKAQKGPQEEEIQAAHAAMMSAKARLDRLVNGWREEEKAQALHDMESAKADADWAENLLRRDERLYTENRAALSPTELETSRANRDRARGRYAAAKSRVAMLQAGSREEDKAEARADHDRAKAQYELLRKGTREEDKAAAAAQLREAQARLAEIEAMCAEAEVRAPGRALVEVVSVRAGDLVQPNQPIIRVLKAEDVWVKVYVPETELGKVHKNQPAEVLIDSHPGRRFTGRVAHVASISEFLPRNVQSVDERRNQVFGIKIIVSEQDAEKIFKPGMAATVRLAFPQ